MMKFQKTLYSKIALLKAAYNFTDRAYVHLDADNEYYYVSIRPKAENSPISEEEFGNEILAQSVRHEVYLQTKNIRELLMARAMASSLVVSPESKEDTAAEELFTEDEILKDWFADHENASS